MVMAESNDTTYIHGTTPQEQQRLAALGELTDDAFVRFLRFEPNHSILDVGSGLGNLARRVAALVPRGEVLGIEQSPDQLARATSNLPNLHFFQGDAHALPFPAGRYDVVYCRYLLEHVREPLTVLREMRRVLKPGGQVFLQENNILINDTDPECPCFDHIWQQFAKLQERLGGDALIGKKLFRLLRQAGFDQIELSIQPEFHHFGSPVYRPWLDNLIGNIRSGQARLVAEGLADKTDIEAAVEEFERLKENPLGSAFFYWNRASAQA
jgi:ubiquinone/menaquinone biosynthesis C-methylase UbiE